MSRPRPPGPGQLTLGLPGIPSAIGRSTNPARPRAPRQARVLRSVPDLPPTPPPPRRVVVGPTVQGKGELQGPASTPRQHHVVDLRVEQLADGWWKFTMPRVPEWGAAARNPGEVTAAIRRSFTERQIVGYADFRGSVYDGATVHKRHQPMARSSRRCDVYQPTEWRLDPDKPGVWISPKGHRYPETRQAVQRVIAARRALGLPARPDPVHPEPVARAAMVAQDLDALIDRGRSA